MTVFYQTDRKDYAATATLWAEFLSAANDGHQSVFMIIDAAHDSRIFPALERSVHMRSCLFADEKISSVVKSVSPFLVKIKNIDEFILWCLREGLHQHWMVFFTSTEIHVSDLKLHFKRFSLGYTADGKQYFFRYFDPRVLPAFLSASDQRERADFFRRLKKMWVPQVSTTGSIQFLQLDAEGELQILNYLLPS